MVLNGFGGPDRVAAGLIARRRHRPKVIFTDCTWKPGSHGLDRLATRAAFRAIDGPHVRFCVLSDDERQRFPTTWGVSPDRVLVCHWNHGLEQHELSQPVSDDGPIFAGGRSLRDYRALVAAAATMPFEVRIAADPSGLSGIDTLSPNVTVELIPEAQYLDLMRRASVVVVPLEDRSDRSAGQMTYLAAMALGKTVIVTDTLGVRDYIEPDRTGLIVPPNDPRALQDALLWSQDPVNRQAVWVQGRARATVREKFSPDRYVSNLLAIVDAGS